jgi:hypothetical protein
MQGAPRDLGEGGAAEKAGQTQTGECFGVALIMVNEPTSSILAHLPLCAIKKQNRAQIVVQIGRLQSKQQLVFFHVKCQLPSQFDDHDDSKCQALSASMSVF